MMTEERRTGMEEVSKRLASLEATAGIQGATLLRIESTLGSVDTAIRGNSKPGLTERVRKLEGFKDAGRKGDTSLIDRVGKLEGNQKLMLWGISGLASAAAAGAWQWVRTRFLGG
jgi:hypothetical protein